MATGDTELLGQHAVAAEFPLIVYCHSVLVSIDVHYPFDLFEVRVFDHVLDVQSLRHLLGDQRVGLYANLMP